MSINHWFSKLCFHLFYHLSAWYCTDIVRRNSVSVTFGGKGLTDEPQWKWKSHWYEHYSNLGFLVWTVDPRFKISFNFTLGWPLRPPQWSSHHPTCWGPSSKSWLCHGTSIICHEQLFHKPGHGSDWTLGEDKWIQNWCLHAAQEGERISGKILDDEL